MKSEIDRYNLDLKHSVYPSTLQQEPYIIKKFNAQHKVNIMLFIHVLINVKMLTIRIMRKIYLFPSILVFFTN